MTIQRWIGSQVCDKFVYLTQNAVCRHEVEMVRVRRHTNYIFGKFFAENTGIKILESQSCQCDTMSRLTREHQP